MLFAFLLASFPAQNSDLWLHLAAGRNLLQPHNPDGVLPSLTASTRTREFLLYDLLTYGLYSALGGSGLVFVKALLVAGIALILMQVSRLGTSFRWPAVCTTLAMLAMAIRLPLQPSTLSCFLLALTLLFVRPISPAERPLAWLPPWPLLLVFVIWANIDRWFVVGLGVTALTWLGQAADEPALAGHRLQALGRRLVCIAALAAACLLNPIHIHAFALPAELTAKQIVSPFRRAYFDGIARIPAGLAYYLLFVLSLLSFALNLRRWRWQRFLPWLAVAGLSAAQARAIPFFAVVAGPAMAWNIQEYLSRHVEAWRWDPRWRFAQAVSAPLMTLAGAALLVCAWPGWLQFPPFEPRRWAVDLPVSLESGAMTVHRWRQESKLTPETRWLHISPETASVFAWFNPGESAVFNAQLGAAIRGETAMPDFIQRMVTAGITHVVVYDSDRNRQSAALANMLADPAHWPLLHLDGNLAIFGWVRPDYDKAADPFPLFGPKLDLEHLAFHPPDDKKAPSKPPERQAEPRRWWQAFWKRLPRQTVDGEEAAFHLFHAELLRRSAPERHMAVWETGLSASLIGASLGWSGPTDLFDARVRLSLLKAQTPEPGASIEESPVPDQAAWILQQRFTLQRDDTPPALLFLAIRAARRAIKINPQDAQSYLVLGESYYRLLHSTRERAWSAHYQELVQLRRVQASAALNEAIRLNPSLADAHLRLSELYREMNYLDLTLKHLRIYYNLTRRSLRSREAADDGIREQEAQYQKEIDRLSKQLETQKKSFSAGAAKAKLLDRAKAAIGLGLAETARDMLLASDISAFGPEGATLELELLLKTGRYREVRDWISPDEAAILGAPSYYWLRVQALAAAGDYAEAELESDHLAQSVAFETMGNQPIRLSHVIALLIGQAMLEEHPGATPAPMLAYRAYLRMNFQQEITSLLLRMKQEADANVMRGLLALEEGEVLEARFAFRTAIALWKNEKAAASTTGVDFASRPVAEAYLKWLQ